MRTGARTGTRIGARIRIGAGIWFVGSLSWACLASGCARVPEVIVADSAGVPIQGARVGAPVPTASALELRLEVVQTPITRWDEQVIQVHIHNVDVPEVTLVHPGDGSTDRWRTPHVGWSILPAESPESHPAEPVYRSDIRCGLMNALKADEVFVLKRGESKELHAWLGFPTGLAPGRYRAVFYYTNVPGQGFGGDVSGEHDPVALRRLRDSTPASLVSNEAEFEVAP